MGRTSRKGSALSESYTTTSPTRRPAVGSSTITAYTIRMNRLMQAGPSGFRALHRGTRNTRTRYCRTVEILQMGHNGFKERVCDG